jgi:polysaccharide export outer membrane protein
MCISRYPTLASQVIRHVMPGGIRLLTVAALLSLCSLARLGQGQRPALVQNSQGASSGAAAASASALNNLGELTDGPIFPGDTVHVLVFDAPDFSLVMRVSENGDIAVPMIGSVRLAGLNSASAAETIAGQLKALNLMPDPHVTVTVDSSPSAITVLGEVHNPGIYPPPGKHMLSDLLATAGGLTANTGRVIEISNDRTPDLKVDLPWDPTMHNTGNYDRPVRAGDRVFVRACGIAYVGGNVVKPGAYSLCGSPQMTLSEVIALAGGIAPLSAESHTFLVRAQPDGTKTVQQIDVHKVLRAKVADPLVREDDIIYVSPSSLKEAVNRAMTFALGLAGPLLYTYHP